MSQSPGPTVESIMTRHVITVSMDDTLRHVRDLFRSVKFHHLVVMENGSVAGVLSDRDLLKNVSPFVGKVTERTQDSFTLAKKVHQIMSRRLVSCGPDMTLAEAGRLMLDRQVSCLPVLDRAGQCVGIVTMRDILSWSLVQCLGESASCPLPRAA
jgi:acetoin utilization protein AcuB